jgi:hypothetical protein
VPCRSGIITELCRAPDLEPDSPSFSIEETKARQRTPRELWSTAGPLRVALSRHSCPQTSSERLLRNHAYACPRPFSRRLHFCLPKGVTKRSSAISTQTSAVASQTGTPASEQFLDGGVQELAPRRMSHVWLWRYPLPFRVIACRNPAAGARCRSRRYRAALIRGRLSVLPLSCLALGDINEVPSQRNPSSWKEVFTYRESPSPSR